MTDTINPYLGKAQEAAKEKRYENKIPHQKSK